MNHHYYCLLLTSCVASLLKGVTPFSVNSVTSAKQLARHEPLECKNLRCNFHLPSSGALQPRRRISSTVLHLHEKVQDDADERLTTSSEGFRQSHHNWIDRRSVLSFLATSSLLQTSQVASADESPSIQTISQAQIKDFLSPIPTFAIVEKQGAPYFVVGEDAKLTTYFFTTYEEAYRILNLAKDSASRSLSESLSEMNEQRREKKEKPIRKGTKEMEELVGKNPWVDGVISTVPLDFAVTLANKRKIGGAYFRVAPSENDIEDALAIDNINDLEEGKVPLFYFEDFTILEKGKGSTSPLYFSKAQLISAFKKQEGSKDIPEIRVTELFTLLNTMVSSTSTSDIEELLKLKLIPPESSIKQAEVCRNRMGKGDAYKLGERIVVL